MIEKLFASKNRIKILEPYELCIWEDNCANTTFEYPYLAKNDWNHLYDLNDNEEVALKDGGNLPVSSEYKVYSNQNLLSNSLGEKTSIGDNFLNILSPEKIGQFNLSASAKYCTSFKCLESNFSACGRNSENSDLEINVICPRTKSNAFSNSCSDNFVIFENSSLCFFNSVNKKSGATKLNLLNNLFNENILDDSPLFQSEDRTTLTSTTNSIFDCYSLEYLLYNDLLILSDNSSACSCVNWDLETILLNSFTSSNLDLINFPTNIDQSMLGTCLINSSSSGISNRISVINLDRNSDYLNLSEFSLQLITNDIWNKEYDKFNGKYDNRWIGVYDLKEDESIAVQKLNHEKDNEVCLGRLGGHSTLKTFFVPQVLIQNEFSRLGQGTIDKNEITYLNFSANYASNSIISLFDNILILDCSLNEGSFDQIGQFNLNASAKNGMSFSCINCFACNSNFLNESLGIILINGINLDSFELNCSVLSLEYFKISCLFFFNSSIAYSGENNCRFNDLDLEIISLTGLGLKNETNIFVSTTNIIYQPSALYLFHMPSLILLPISTDQSVNPLSSSCLSLVNISSLQANCLALDSIQALTNPDQFISGKLFILSLTSSGTDKVIDTILPVEKRKNVELFKSFDFNTNVLFDNTTSEHPYLTEKGWIKVKELEAGDYIAVLRECYNFNSLTKSDVENILTEDCLLKPGSLDQIAQHNFNASANIGISLSCINCLAWDSKGLENSSGIIFMESFNSSKIESICADCNLEYFEIDDLIFNNSCQQCSGEYNSKSNDCALIIINRTGLSLKKDINMFVSATNCIHHPSFFNLFQAFSFTSFPNLRQSSSVNSEFSNNLSNFLSNKALLTFSHKNLRIDSERFNSGKSSICFFNSSDIDKVMFGILDNSVYSVEYVQLFKSFDFNIDTKLNLSGGTMTGNLNLSANVNLTMNRGNQIGSNVTCVTIKGSTSILEVC